MVTIKNEINTQLVLIINMDATDSTEYITNCVGSMNIHILLVKILLTFGFLRKPYKQHILKGWKRTMIDKAISDSGIASYTVKWVEDIDKINDACEIRIMIDQPNEYMREIIVKKIREKWPNNLKINEIPMPSGIYIMIPESLAKETANKQGDSVTNVDDKDGITDTAEKDEYAAWHAEFVKHAKVITSSIFNSTSWNSKELMKSLDFIIDSADKRRKMTPEDCLQTFELHHIQSINLIYWGLRFSADTNEPDDYARNTLHNAILHACDILYTWAKEKINGVGTTVFELIHFLSDDKKDENDEDNSNNSNDNRSSSRSTLS